MMFRCGVILSSYFIVFLLVKFFADVQVLGSVYPFGEGRVSNLF